MQTVLNIEIESTQILKIVIGSGGTGDKLDSNSMATAGNGGTTTVSKDDSQIISAVGGGGGRNTPTAVSGVGNGDGGVSANNPNGKDGTGYIFNDSSLGLAGGGGGSFAKLINTEEQPAPAGKPKGGKGGVGYAQIYHQNEAGFIPGGGAGAGLAVYRSGQHVQIDGKNGGAGGVYIRFKSA